MAALAPPIFTLTWALFMRRSIAAGRRITLHDVGLFSDGTAVKTVGEETFRLTQMLVDDIVTVSDAQLVQAMRFAAARMKMVVEPTGALAMAAAMQGALDLRGKRVGVIVSGGNIDISQLAQYLAA